MTHPGTHPDTHLEGTPPFTVHRATTADCELIQRMAQEVFPATYRSILSDAQIAYMMEWMYAPGSILHQMEAEGHVYLIAYKDDEPAGYVSVQPEGEDLFCLQKIYVLPRYQGLHCGRFLFNEAVKYIRSVHPAPCRMELHVNRHNTAVHFYEHLGMRKLRQGDFDIGCGYQMNDYIMGMELF